MKTYLILLLFLFSSVNAFALTGYWERMHPELNGEVPGPRFNAYICPIGERKVLMLNGDGPGNPYYYNDTWLYHYDEDRWQRVQCDSQPDTYNNYYNYPLISISKNVAIAKSYEDVVGNRTRYWVFYLDSLKWVRLDSSGLMIDYYSVPYSDGKMVCYVQVAYSNPPKYGGRTYMCEFDLHTLQAKNTVVSDTGAYGLREAAGSYMGVEWYYGDKGDILNSNNPVFFTPGADISYFPDHTRLPFIYFDTSDFKWKDVERDFEIKPRAYNIRNLLDNILLTYSNMLDTTYFYYYDSASNKMKEESIIFLNNRPEIEHPNYQNKMVKIKDSVVLFFGGYKDEYGKKDSETWVFRLTDTTTVIDTAGEDTGHIFYVGNNSYFLKEIESAELYDLQGILMGKYYDNGVVDLNKYANGAYLLRYTIDGKKYRTEKIIKK